MLRLTRRAISASPLDKAPWFLDVFPAGTTPAIQGIPGGLAAGAYTRPLLSSTWAVSDTKHTLSTP
jgi:glutathione S-transferase